jgi:hypothetical protein
MPALEMRAAGEQAFRALKAGTRPDARRQCERAGASSIDSIDNPEWKRREARGEFL